MPLPHTIRVQYKVFFVFLYHIFLPWVVGPRPLLLLLLFPPSAISRGEGGGSGEVVVGLYRYKEREGKKKRENIIEFTQVF